MTISCSQQWPERVGGGKTYFMEQILNTLDYGVASMFYRVTYGVNLGDAYRPEGVLCKWVDAKGIEREYHLYLDPSIAQEKQHTIRAMQPGKEGRWKKGQDIHFKIWTGKPYASPTFAFAPVVECTGVQDVRIYWVHSEAYGILIDQKCQFTSIISAKEDARGYKFIREFSRSDGFESQVEFFKWFDKDFRGELVHWTDKTY